MKIIATINGWKTTPHCWRHFLLNPLRVQREPVLIIRSGKLAIQKAPAVYSIQVFGFVLFVELTGGLPA